MNFLFPNYSKKLHQEFIERTLIDIACINSGMLIKHKTNSRKKFFNFDSIQKGIPILTPFIPEIMESNDFFCIDISEYSKIIYGNNSQNYIGTNLSYKTNIFVKNFEFKKNFKKIINGYTNEILTTKLKVSALKNKYKTIGAFQTRNIPHLGHEKIIEMMLNHCDVVVINPIIGPKKPGDIKIEKLKYIYENILKPRFNNRIYYLPIKANMFYAGPREAIHHSIIREWLGFSHFSIGRDHAGADGFYDPKSARTVLRKFKNKFKIKILDHNGAYYCKKCKKITLKGNCIHNEIEFEEISGSKFRYYLRNNKKYKYASKDIQEWSSKNFATFS